MVHSDNTWICHENLTLEKMILDFSLMCIRCNNDTQNSCAIESDMRSSLKRMFETQL